MTNKKIHIWLTLIVVLFLALIGTAYQPDQDVAPNPEVIYIALVFDDGPFPNHAPQLLALLAKEQVNVTFAMVASNVHKFQSTAKAIVAGGHEVACHSYSHRHPKDLDDAALEQEIVGAQKIITEVTGRPPKWYWPPFLEMDDRMPAIADKAGMEIYSLKNVVVSKDYDSGVGRRGIKRNATRKVVDGSVIVFHEWRVETREQMPAIIAELRRQNCVFLTFSELAEKNRSKNPSAK